MSDERVRNDVPGSVVGSVTQVGSLHGNMYVHPSPVQTERPADRAIRIACSITDTEQKSSTLDKIAERLTENDPEHAEQAGELVPDQATRKQCLARLAFKIVEQDPERAHRLAEPLVDEPVGTYTWLLAVVAVVTAGRDPQRSDLLTRQVVEARPDEPILLAFLSNARRTTDPASAERLADLAEQLATASPERFSGDHTLQWVAHTVAVDDPRRAERVLRHISLDWWCYVPFWSDQVTGAASSHRAHAFAMIDTATSVMQKIPAGNGDDCLKDLAILAASLDPDRAERIANMISPSEHRIRAFAEMARQAADRAHAWRWLSTAEKAAAGSYDLLGIVAAAGIKVAPSVSGRIVRQIFDAVEPGATDRVLIGLARCLAAADPARALQLIDRTNADAEDHRLQVNIRWALVSVSWSFIAIDPATALETANRLKFPLGSEYTSVRLATVNLLVEIAKTLAVWDPEQAKTVLNRAQLELRTIDTIDPSKVEDAWRGLAAALVQVDPAPAGRLAVQLQDVPQNELLAALTTVDPAAAERIARSVTDRPCRDKALAAIALAAISS